MLARTLAAQGSAKKKKSKAEDVAEAAAGFVDAQAKMAAAKEQSSSSAVTWQPQALKHPLKDYQLEGLKWMATLYENGLSGILADESACRLFVDTAVGTVALFSRP